MQKFFLWTAFIVSALAVVDTASLEKRANDSSCAQQLNAQPDEAGVVQVTVGSMNGSLRYYPDDISPLAPGTIVQFNFMPKNHTVTESSFADPCKPLSANLTSETRPGLKTGFVPVTGTEDFTPAFRIRINDTKPMWLYCGQTSHCQKGMVMVINQNRSDTTDKTLENFRAKAAQVSLPAGSPPAAASSPAASAPAVTPVSPPSSTTDPGPALASSSTAAASSPLISVFNGAAAPKQQPGHAELLVLLAAGAIVLL